MTVTIALTSDHLQAIYTQAERTYPDECCGLLLGTLAPELKQVVAVQAVENAWEPEVAAELADAPELTKSRRYWIAPEQMLAGMRAARQQGLAVIGIYHSHPDCPATPSECDRRLAWSDYSYLIVSVVQAQAQTCHSWVLDDQHQFQAEDLRVMSAIVP